ncbi:MAG TPA: hypothetical protein VF586_15955 [Pyrinomonadaceae bacterium]
MKILPAPSPLTTTELARPGGAGLGGRHVASIAVLPFANEGGEADLEYLCDGITEALINALSLLPRLKVMARSTVFRHRGPGADVRRIGGALDVQAVLTGRVLRSGGRLVISVEVADAGDGSQVWGARFTYAAAGRRGEARRILGRLLAASRRGYTPPFYLALIHVGLGETDAALDWLERAYESRDGDLTTIKVDPRLDCLGPDPRFTRLLRRLGLDA